MSKKKFPKTLLAMRDTDDGEYFICVETPEDISEEFADEPVAVYQLIALGKFSVEKQVDAKPIKKLSVGTTSKVVEVCNACGHTRAWHDKHRPRHVFIAR